MIRRKAILLLVLFTLLFLNIGNARDVFHGSLQRYENGAVVDIHRSFAVIPEYREIEDRGLTTEDAEYYVLLAQANDHFYAAVRTVARREGYDMIARKNSPPVQNLDLPDITESVIVVLTGDD